MKLTLQPSNPRNFQPSNPLTLQTSNPPTLIPGGIHSDARGTLRFCNDFDMSQIRRFYTIANSSEQPCRGWLGHLLETKWFFPLKGRTTIMVVAMDGDLNQESAPQKTILDARNPAVLQVGPGNWFCIEQDGDSEVQVFSNCRLAEFPNDDFRLPLTALTF